MPSPEEPKNGKLAAPRFAPTQEVSTTEMKVGNITQPRDRHVTKVNPRSGGVPMLMDGDMLNVTNDGKLPIVFRWARRAYTVDPGETGFVPFEALVDTLGDPRSMDDMVIKYEDEAGNRGIVPRRYDELSRMFARYGVQNEDPVELVRKSPKLTVSDLKGSLVLFPACVPDMNAYPTPNADEGHVSADVTRMVDKVRNENRELRDRLDAMEAALEANYRDREAVSEPA